MAGLKPLYTARIIEKRLSVAGRFVDRTISISRRWQCGNKHDVRQLSIYEDAIIARSTQPIHPISSHLLHELATSTVLMCPLATVW